MKIKLLSILLVISTFAVGQELNKVDAQNRKQGKWEVFYNNSAEYKYIGEFKDDKPIGIFTYYYYSGRIKAKVNYKNGGAVTLSEVYHETSGKIKAQGKYINQKKDSVWTYFDNVGNVKSKESYTNGKLEGQRVIYYEPVGGQYIVARFEYYKNGVLDGTFKEYHQNKKLKAEGNYKDGNLNGTIKYYYANGKAERLERYKYAVKHGYWVFYNKDGSQAGTKLFWEGKLLKGEALEKKKAELKAQK
ncbi:MAG: toxin-antitoxin system YwqK family antitoxin [Crocinitomicaceae bacterium]